MTSLELRQKYLKFFQSKGHKIIPSASLIPPEEVELAGTERVLFTTAGMHPLIPYLLGKTHSEGKRLVNIQKCLRTDDIDDVGDTTHNTFFEMLGNWSLGDPASPARSAGSRRDGIGQGGPASTSLGGYWKKEAISWSYEFLINKLKLDAKRIYVSVFAGDEDAPFDQESFDTWKTLGIPENHIAKYGKGDNWWPTGGEKPGPQGPDTEMFYDTNPASKSPIDPSVNNQRFVEIWNDVFMQYERNNDGSYSELKQKNVDTGMGLERILTVLQNVPSIYETDVFLPLMKKIEDLSSVFIESSARIVADHIRASVFLIADSVTPSNVDRGYILRRLIRRTIRHAALLKIDQEFLRDLSKMVIKTYGDIYPSLSEHQELITQELQKEEQKFKKALDVGIKHFEKISGNISAQNAFDLYQNFGFPIELTVELAKEKNKKVNSAGFEKLLKTHQELSRSAGEKTKGGLAIQSDTAAKYHTATHILHQALREVLGEHVHQTGSHITNERLRFDFVHHEKLTDQQIKSVEDLVNQKIRENLPVRQETMPKGVADEIGAIGLFREKYGDLVNIYFIGQSPDPKLAFSKEFCGGPHAKSTGELNNFKINKEESAGSGIRRIYATID
ncbi:MAG: Alanine-tRNA ligase [Candidatus Curtissbacteria bacterium GW2011_GWA1_40_16]|uniref:Alanine--tRNA ligase n=1 Tax=Candidatus Curtissbacteria bacterium GW2011_GWA1_40_16 TaxID=1618405 RepID=A0A0G0RCL5_9BACT|nr:MAG: Alanine-tRNA ligase [Candidatus Curtissbacteria bacterium GW2011_GWA1_40_16]